MQACTGLRDLSSATQLDCFCFTLKLKTTTATFSVFDAARDAAVCVYWSVPMIFGALQDFFYRIP